VNSIDIQNALLDYSKSFSSIVVTQSDDVVYLKGRVKTYFYKQVAQELVRNMTKSSTIANEIVVANSQT